MDSKGGTYAINGAFFCPAGYKRCEANTTDQLRISNGVLLSKWKTDVAKGQSVFGFDKDGKPSMVSGRPSEGRFWDQNINQRNHAGLAQIYNGIMMYTLLEKGVNVAIHNEKMNADPKQKKAGSKSFLCTNQDHSFVYMGFVDKQTFSSLPDYLTKYFACYDAIMLDNGGTKAMIFDKKYVAGPGRNMMDAVIIVEQNNSSLDKKTQASSTLKEDGKTQSSSAKIQLYQKILTQYFTSKNFSRSQQEQTIQSLIVSFSSLLSSVAKGSKMYTDYQELLEALKTFPYVL